MKPQEKTYCAYEMIHCKAEALLLKCVTSELPINEEEEEMIDDNDKV